LPVLFGGAFEFTQMMGVAEEMDAKELEVGFPVIVTETSAEVLQDAHGFDGVAAAFGMGKEPGPVLVTKAVQPVEGLVDMDAGFVGVQKPLLNQFAGKKGFERLQQDVGFLIKAEYRAGTDRDTALIPEVVADAVIRDELLLRRVDRLNLNALSILHVPGHSIRKWGNELTAVCIF
jgi:hypothetical protein